MVQIMPNAVKRKTRVREGAHAYLNGNLLVANAVMTRMLGMDINKGPGLTRARLEAEKSDSTEEQKLKVTFFYHQGISSKQAREQNPESFPVCLGPKNGNLYLQLFDFIRNKDFFPQPVAGEKLSAEIISFKVEEEPRSLELVIKTKIVIKS